MPEPQFMEYSAQVRHPLHPGTDGTVRSYAPPAPCPVLRTVWSYQVNAELCAQQVQHRSHVARLLLTPLLSLADPATGRIRVSASCSRTALRCVIARR
eukprot:674209-Rhodomonas_salina.3